LGRERREAAQSDIGPTATTIQTGLREINRDVLEEDFWTTSRYLAEITDAI
jgi:hypothetical protein